MGKIMSFLDDLRESVQISEDKPKDEEENKEVENMGKLSSFLDELSTNYLQNEMEISDNKTKEEKKEISNNEQEYRNNGISMALKLIAIIEIIAGVVVGFMMFGNSVGSGIGILVGTIATGMLVMGIGEIIQLLEDIKNK